MAAILPHRGPGSAALTLQGWGGNVIVFASPLRPAYHWLGNLRADRPLVAGYQQSGTYIVMIPDWNSQGVLPPVRPGAGGTAADRSPYRVSLHQLVTTFATSPERATVLRGFLDYRAALHAAGIIVGFQWVDGSFVENIEALEGREPNDMDVVTFCAVPEEEYAHLFNNPAVKADFHIDAYLCRVDLPLISERVELIAYWYSMFAHRRNGLWKGFVAVDLSPFEDLDARNALNEIIEKEGWAL